LYDAGGGWLVRTRVLVADGRQTLHAATAQQLEKQLEAVDISIEEHGGRITVMEEHLKNVRQEIAYTESRVSSAAA
jgi:hypothetical protein